jgi:aminopeptidase N
MQHEAFSLTNPNKVRAVVGCLQLQAPSVLFTSDVLELVGEIICAVDATNGNLAASLCKMLQCWRKLPSPLQQQAKAVLERVQRREGCSKNAGEVAATALK